MAPLLLALKSLVAADSRLKDAFLAQKSALSTLFQLTSQSQTHPSFKNLYISGLLLMCELEFDETQLDESGVRVFKDIISDRIMEMKVGYEEMELDV